MRSVVLSALTLLCVAEIGLCLQCYTCTMATDDQKCLSTTNCTGSTPYCGTAVVNAAVVTFMNKYCSSACLASNQNFTVVSATENCCSTNLCNTMTLGSNNFNFGNGASSLSSGLLLMAAAAGLLGVMLHL
ncbi:ly6/PLAUR domain-containing protein 2-like [Hyperolius riggenbachi]|uniref:ly6/PLAUR domain-containing protein 2-like n=1 Tax=Hyperolius riggenbachi TaxID=752182 RepID=UPI0035A313D1